MADRGPATVTVDGHRIALSKPDKVLFPDAGLTKGDLVDYYRRIAPVALPHWRGRALSMQRFPDGIGAEGFFQKDVPDHFPDWIARAALPKQGGTVTYVVAESAATLVYLADQGCVTPHLSLARADRPNHPDRLVLDLDPSDRDFAKVQRAARLVRGLLDALDMACFVQTTGSRGLHVVVPLDRSADFEQARLFARAAAERLAARHPDLLTVEQRKDRRGDRVFVDYLRNAYGQTSVAPYAVRAIAGAPVATPLHWREAGAGDLEPRRYTIRNIFRRLAQTDDPWEPIFRCRYSVAAAHKRHDALDGRG
jgi:bifunctional non-homologous end joining protein LigD